MLAVSSCLVYKLRVHNGRNRLSAESMAPNRKSIRKVQSEGRLGLRASLQPWHSFIVGLPKFPPYPGCCLAQHSNHALGHGPELQIPAPLMRGEGNGRPEQCGRRWLRHLTKTYVRNID